MSRLVRSPGSSPMRRRPARSLAVIALVVAVLAAGCAADFRQRLGDTTHSSHTTDTGLSAANVGTLKEQWRYRPGPCNGVTTGAQWFATPVTFKGVIYIGDDYGCLHAIDEATGRVLWTRFHMFVTSTTCGQPLGIVSSINVTDDGTGRPVLYFHAPDGYLYKLRGADGSTIWRSLVQVPSATANDVYAWSSPTVAGDKVIVGISSNCDTPFVQGQVRAYDTATGRLLWTHTTIPDGFAGAGDWYDAAVDAAGDVYVSTGSTYDDTAAAHPNTTPGFEQYSILKLRGSTGALIWKAPAPEFLGDPDYGTSPILFDGGGVGLVGAWNKDGWFRAYRRDNGAFAWQAKTGSTGTETDNSLAGGALSDGHRLFIASNPTKVGGTWTQTSPGHWEPVGGTSVPGSVRELDPATGALVSRGGRRFEIGLPVSVMGPCSINGRDILVCAGGNLEHADIGNGHDNGLYVIDANASVPAVLRHLSDRDGSGATQNWGEFAQPIQEFGAIIAANNAYLTKWGQ
jgi:outer membrane protein assembly factor BamB